MDRRQYAPNHRSNNSGAEIIQSEPMSTQSVYTTGLFRQ